MESFLKIIFSFINIILFSSIILALINGRSGQKLEEIPDSSKYQMNVKNVSKSSDELVTSGQHFRYNYAKDGDSYGNNDYENNGKSYLKEFQYIHDKEVGFERKHDWDSDNEQALLSKKIKKDLYNRRNYRKNYNFDDMIEVKKWDDEEPNIHTNNFNNNYKQDNYDNFGHQNKNKVSFDSNTNRNYNNINNNNNQNYKSDDNRDNSNYSHRKYGTQERSDEERPLQSSEERGRDYSGYDEDNQKWFTNMEDKDQSGSTDNEVKNEDNYNNFNSPKFIVNFHNFKPWNRIMRNRRQENNNYENTDQINDDLQDNFEIYSNERSATTPVNKPDDVFNYEPKLITNFSIKMQNKIKDNYSNSNDNNNENYNKNKSNERQMRYKTTDFKEAVKKLKSRPKNMRYHYEKRVMPQNYADFIPKKDDVYGNGYESGARSGGDNNYRQPSKHEMDKQFIEMPFDTFNSGWSSVRQPIRQKSDHKVVPKVTQYRYGF